MEYLTLLKHQHFTKLWMAQILSQLGQNLLNFALIILVFDLTRGSSFANLSVGMVVLAFGVPSLLFGSVAGIYVDFWDRRSILIISNLLRAILVLGYVIFSHNLLLILLLSFVISTIMQFFIPAETACIPKLVEKPLLLTANTMFVFSLYAAFIVGYSSSGPVIQLLGRDGPFWAVATLFGVATILCALLPKQPVRRQSIKLPAPHLLKHLQQNWELVHTHGERFFSILQLTVTQGLVSVLVTLAPALSLALLHVPLESASKVLIIPIGTGMVAGAALVGRVSRHNAKVKVIQTCLIIAAITLTLIGLSGQLYRTEDGHTIVPITYISIIVGTLMFVLGFMNAMISANAQALLQEHTSDEYRGRIFASLNMLVNLASTLPILFVAGLADLLSVTKVIMIIGGSLTLYAIYMAWHYRPVIQNQNSRP